MTDLGSGDARIRELMRELSELRDRHETVARVFQDLARSHMRLQPILDQIAEAMTSLLRSEYSLIHLTEGSCFTFRRTLGCRLRLWSMSGCTRLGRALRR